MCDDALLLNQAGDVRSCSGHGVILRELVSEHVLDQSSRHALQLQSQAALVSVERVALDPELVDQLAAIRGASASTLALASTHSCTRRSAETMAELNSHLPVASTSALDPPPERATFASLGVEPFLCKALQAMAIRKPTAVQAACIPAILKGTPSPCPNPSP